MTAVPASALIPAVNVQIVGRDLQLADALGRLMEMDAAIGVTARTATAGAVGRLKPDVLLYMEDPSEAPSTLEYARAASPATTFCVLDALRDLTIGEFLNAIKAMAPAAPRHLQPVPAGGTRDMRQVLSERELEVVRLIAEGLSNKEISSRLSLSDKTVKNHISHILAKLNLTARTQVAVMALRVGIAR